MVYVLSGIAASTGVGVAAGTGTSCPWYNFYRDANLALFIQY